MAYATPFRDDDASYMESVYKYLDKEMSIEYRN